jgi:hypothetical protein
MSSDWLEGSDWRLAIGDWLIVAVQQSGEHEMPGYFSNAGHFR